MKSIARCFLFLMILLALPGPSSPAMAQTTGFLYFDLALDEPRKVLYGSDQIGGKINVISTDTLAVIASIPVGMEPAGIDISPDGKELAVALNGQEQIAFVDLDTRKVTERVTPAGVTGENMPYDVVYGRAGRLYSSGYPESGGLDYIHVIDTGVSPKVEIGRSGEVVSGGDRLAMSADKNTLYFMESRVSPQNLHRFDVTSDTPTETARGPHGPVHGNTLCLDPNGTVYSSSMQAWSPDLSTMLGEVSLIDRSYDFDNEIECVPSQHKVFVSHENTLIEIDSSGIVFTFKYAFPNKAGVARANAAGTLLYLSTEGGIKKLRADYTVQKTGLPLVNYNSCSDYSEHFDAPTPLWYSGEDADAKVGFAEGSYQVISKQPYLYMFRPLSCDRFTYKVAVDARWNGSVGSDIGLLVGITGNFDSYYFITLNVAGRYYTVNHYQDGEYTIVRGPMGNQLVRPYNLVNHIEVTYGPWGFPIYLNGSFLDTVVISKPELVYTAAGIAMAPYAPYPNAEARFDNFEITTTHPEGLNALTQGDLSALPLPEVFQPHWLKAIGR